MAVFDLYNRNDILRYSFETELDGEVFRLSLAYNDCATCWFMDVFDANGTLLRAGVKLVVNVPLFVGWNDSRRPKGDVMAFRPRPRDDRSQLTGPRELGDTVFLTYQGEF